MCAQNCPDAPPKRLTKLIKRLAQLQPGQAYAITLFVADENSEPTWTVLLLGKIENYTRQEGGGVVR